MEKSPDDLPYSPATERNKAPILEVLQTVFSHTETVLEIGSGTGQHALHFAQHLPHIHWIPSETRARQATLKPRLQQASLDNIATPVVLDVCDTPWPVPPVQGVFAANVAHIMGWEAVVAMFAGVAQVLEASGSFCLYGPFNYNGEFTRNSNAAFDAQLRQRDPAMGIRDMDDLQTLAQTHHLKLAADHPMPANNRLLVWQ